MVLCENGKVTIVGDDFGAIGSDIATTMSAVHDFEIKKGIASESFTLAEACFYIEAAFISFYKEKLNLELVNSEIGQKHMVEASRTYVNTLLSVYGKEKSNE